VGAYGHDTGAAAVKGVLERIGDQLGHDHSSRDCLLESHLEGLELALECDARIARRVGLLQILGQAFEIAAEVDRLEVYGAIERLMDSSHGVDAVGTVLEDAS
jgi:hypothetical protein